jgi:hypothetical protein
MTVIAFLGLQAFFAFIMLSFVWIISRKFQTFISSGGWKFLVPSVASASADLIIEMQVLEKMMDQLDLEKEVPNLIEENFDSLVSGINEKIPMASMFLNGPLLDTLKGEGENALIKSLPNLKGKLLSRVNKKDFLEKSITEQILDLDSKTLLLLLKPQMNGLMRRLYLAALIFGLVSGTVAAAVLAIS